MMFPDARSLLPPDQEAAVAAMRVGIVGAGIAGLAAARKLRQAGHEAIVFESDAELGGRCATQRLGPFVFDTGATSIAPRGLSLERVMVEELPTDELVKVEKPIYMHAMLRVSRGDPLKNKIARYTYRSGNRKLAQLLADGVDVRLSTPVQTLERDAQRGYRILGEEFDALVLTPPAPQTLDLLASIGEFRPMQSIVYRKCLCVLLGFRLPPPLVPYHALVEPDQRHPLTWLSVESLKSPARSPEDGCAVIAQLSPNYSRSNFEAEEAAIVGDTVNYVKRLFGEAWESPEVSGVVRWSFSQPELTATFESVNRKGSRILIAGDGVQGARVENAFESGEKCAQLLIASV